MRAVVVTVTLSSLLVTAAARAQPAPEANEPTVSAARPEIGVSLSFNIPIMWLGDAFGASISWGWGRQALRLNVATYVPWAGGGAAALFGAEDEESSDGGVTDVGIGWMFYPRRLWSGATIELGGIGRFRDTSSSPDDADPARSQTHTMTIAGRGLVGWSWLFGDHVYLSVAAGLSVGYETGTERAETAPDRMTTSDIGRVAVAPEGFMRLGFAWDLTPRGKR